MNNTVLDVLIFLFEHYVDDDTPFSLDRELLRVELREAGFDEEQVIKAFEWLQGLAAQQENEPEGSRDTGNSIRVFTMHEIEKLDLESRGFLLFLEQVGVLNHRNRELVIDRVMALETEEIDLEQLKWVVLMVLFNQPGQEEALVWMEDLVMAEMGSSLH